MKTRQTFVTQHNDKDKKTVWLPSTCTSQSLKVKRLEITALEWSAAEQQEEDGG